MIKEFSPYKPKIHKEVYLAENSTIIGNVEIEEGASIWFGAVLRGDENSIKVGKNSNIQDNAVVHVDDYSVKIGNNVTVGHGAILHGCVIEDECLIGMGSIILNNARIGKNTIVGAGSLVTQNADIPEGVLCLGSPAKVVRKLTEDEINSIKSSARMYFDLSNKYRSEEK
ncbi:gamma carbonic anhydrase family protein [Clostridium sp. YIM B02551]|uniref:gamma carbonic anhydrase family protein n=1 Tax=Clostridium sp. YIM B02551 TaxID=2910679 RepID=UPI001EEAE91C|nr:gamma carbonic anhydrase family protein [Clostridium sp. YIM B02551]